MVLMNPWVVLAIVIFVGVLGFFAGYIVGVGDKKNRQKERD